MSWNDLTPRQKSLDRAIENCGVRLDSSNVCLEKVMKIIGADASEAAFVRGRIVLRLKVQQVLSDTDNFIDRTNRMLDDFEREDERWRKRGRDLGLDL